MQIDTYLRGKGLKITPARKSILEILLGQHEPLDVQSIIKELHTLDIQSDPATVFRTMNVFLEKNIVRQVQLMEGKVRYEILDQKEHHHFICRKCESISDISDCNISILEKKIEELKGVAIEHHALEFYGLCSKCLKSTKRKSV